MSLFLVLARWQFQSDFTRENFLTILFSFLHIGQVNLKIRIFPPITNFDEYLLNIPGSISARSIAKRMRIIVH